MPRGWDELMRQKGNQERESVSTTHVQTDQWGLLVNCHPAYLDVPLLSYVANTVPEVGDELLELVDLGPGPSSRPTQDTQASKSRISNYVHFTVDHSDRTKRLPCRTQVIQHISLQDHVFPKAG